MITKSGQEPTYAETQKLLAELPQEYQKLLGELVPAKITTGGIQRVLQALLAERISVRDLAGIVEAIGEAVGLAEEFAGLPRAREPERLDPWLARARGGPLPAFRGFATRLGVDEAAVRAAATLPWSTGPVEGQINRLKTLKRQMYGRAKLDLLGRRFLLAA